jgi:hypothetical protein
MVNRYTKGINRAIFFDLYLIMAQKIQSARIIPAVASRSCCDSIDENWNAQKRKLQMAMRTKGLNCASK